MMGTPRYMSPEQIRGRDVGPSADVYSLGAVIYHALTGRPPFDGESKFDVLAAHVGLPPTAMRDSFPDCKATPRLEQTVLKCLAKDPAYRFSSMDDLAATLQLCGQELWGDAPPSGSARIPRELLDSRQILPTSSQIKLPSGGAAAVPRSSKSALHPVPGAPEWDSLAPTPSPPSRHTAVGPAWSTMRVIAPGEGRRAGLWVGLAVVVVGWGVGLAAVYGRGLLGEEGATT